ncbi:lysylphosphatidylglycerol synthase transmembrane domain-containing protein [Rhodococcus opacus]|nr:lysylphosphatidylglycerol synthase transmembrane domain-containing protein [Rhodococcus sp. IEGM 1351]MDI9935908.1 lysylphosphatidylglycerol synthase transmembrane domain-containing protein [Rhodococcus sp. IEGM 1351]WKN56340.1 lysylphosphatidylglycerol synthase transmembrane domain-containing protein [Rhodococcus opacus]
MDADPEIVPDRGGRAVLMNALRILVTLAIVVAVVFAVKSQWAEVRDTITQLDWWALAVSAVFVFLGMGAAVRAWQHALGALEHPIPAFDAARCYLVGQLGKYLPGSVWAFVLQTELVRRAGVSRANGFVAVLVTVGLSITSALVVGLLALPALFHISTVAAVAVIVLVPIALVCCYPPVLTRLVNLALRILRRAPLQRQLTMHKIGLALGWCAVSWVLYGVHLWFLASSSAGFEAGTLVQCIGAIALGMCVGVLVVVAPSGIGVREAVVVAALSPFMDSGVALGLALASRLVFTLCEVLAGFVAAIAGSRSLRNALVREDSRVPQPS